MKIYLCAVSVVTNHHQYVSSIFHEHDGPVTNQDLISWAASTAWRRSWPQAVSLRVISFQEVERWNG